MFRSKRFLVTVIIIFTILIAGITYSDTGKSSSIILNSTLEEPQKSAEGGKVSLNYSLQSNDTIIAKPTNDENFSLDSERLDPNGNKIQEYYINDSSKTIDSYNKTDHIVQVENLTMHANNNYGKLYLQKFSLNDLAIDANGNDNLEKEEPVFKDVDGDFHLTQSDYITKNGTVPIGSMNETNTTYFNTNDREENYTKGLAIISYNSNKQIEPGPLDSGDSSLLLRGNAPITGFDETSNSNYVFNISNSPESLSKDSAMIVSDKEGKIHSGPLNGGTTELIKAGKANLRDFGENETFFINSINESKDQFDEGEAIINDTEDGLKGAIDSSDEIVGSGKGFVTIFQYNISTYGSGEVFIGNSDGDQIYSSGEFLYVESGTSLGYQAGEDIVVSNSGNINLAKSHDTAGTFNELNGSGKSNLMFLDLNNNGFLDVEDGSNSDPGSEPIVRTQIEDLKNDQNVGEKDSFLRAASKNESFKTIHGNWFSEPNYQDFSKSKGPQNGDVLRYISPANDNGDFYKGSEPIIEDSNDKRILQKSDYVVLGSDIKNSSHVEIPYKFQFLNLNHTNDYNKSYPIISMESRDYSVLNESDVIKYSGELGNVNDYSEKIEFLDLDKTGTYSKNEAIIKSNHIGDNQIEFGDEILNTISNPGVVQISLMGNYPSDINSEMQVFLSKNQSDTYSRGNPIVNLKTITQIDDNEELEARQLQEFSKPIGFLDENSNDLLDANETIYRENDTQAAGTDTFGDRLTAVTVQNNGSLADQYIDSIALRTDSTTIATASNPTPNGTWVLEPAPDAGWFGPTESTAFRLQTTLSGDAPGGKTVALEIPAANDTDGDGAYDPGETGLFLEQDSPRGGFGPGPTLAVPSKSSGDDGEELPSPIALSIDGPDGNVSVTDEGLSVTITGNASDRSIVVTLQNASDGTAVQSTEATLNSTGGTRVAFDPQSGRYQVHVRAVDTNSSAVSEPFVVEPPTSPGFRSRPADVERGERSPFEVGLGPAENVTVRLERAGGRVLETVVVGPQNGSSTLGLAVETGGIRGQADGAGIVFEKRNRSEGAVSWITDGSSELGENKSGEGSDTPNGTVGGPAKPEPVQSGGPASASNSSHENRTADRPTPPTQSRSAPGALAVGRYTLVLSSDAERRASAAFQVQADWNASFETFVAPRDVTLDSPTDVQAHASAQGEIATGDTVVVAVTTTGLGTLARNISVGGPPASANASETARSKGDPPRGGEATNGTGSPPAFVSLGPKSSGAGPGSVRAAAARRINRTDPDQFYLVGRANGEGIEPGATLKTALVVTDSSPFVPPEAENESIETALDVIEAEAGFDGVSNGSLNLPPAANAPINGTTTVAPGTTLTVHIDGANDSFTETESTTVDEDGTYEATANLSEYESGTDYTVSVTADGDQLSPTRSGQFIADDADLAAAGGGGQRFERDGGESDDDELGDRTEVTPTMEADGPSRIPVSQLPVEAAERAWSAVPEPLRIGLQAIVLSGLGGLALFTVGRGVLKLLWP